MKSRAAFLDTMLRTSFSSRDFSAPLVLCALLFVVGISLFACWPPSSWAGETASTAGSLSASLPDQPAVGQESTSLLAAIAKVVGALTIVVGIMLLLAKLFKKIGFAQGGLSQGLLINIIETRMIAPKKYVAIMKIAGEFFAVGISDQHINLLTKLDGTDLSLRDAAEDTGNKASSLSSSFSAMLNKAAGGVKQKKSQDEKL